MDTSETKNSTRQWCFCPMNNSNKICKEGAFNSLKGITCAPGPRSLQAAMDVATCPGKKGIE